MRSHGSHERVLAAFRRGEVDILLGTQMIAKGLDFPNVTLVGVVNADTALHLPDFRAAERTFQPRRAGRRPDRAGRSRRAACSSRPIRPTSPRSAAPPRTTTSASSRGELPEREKSGVPPFGRIVRLIARGEDLLAVRRYLDELASALPRRGPLGPHPRPGAGAGREDQGPVPRPPPAPRPDAPAAPGGAAGRPAGPSRAAGGRAGGGRRPDEHAVRQSPSDSSGGPGLPIMTRADRAIDPVQALGATMATPSGSVSRIGAARAPRRSVAHGRDRGGRIAGLPPGSSPRRARREVPRVRRPESHGPAAGGHAPRGARLHEAHVPGLLWAVRDPSPHLGFDLFSWWAMGVSVPLFFTIGGFFAARIHESRGLAGFVANRVASDRRPVRRGVGAHPAALLPRLEYRLAGLGPVHVPRDHPDGLPRSGDQVRPVRPGAPLVPRIPDPHARRIRGVPRLRRSRAGPSGAGRTMAARPRGAAGAGDPGGPAAQARARPPRGRHLARPPQLVPARSRPAALLRGLLRLRGPRPSRAGPARCARRAGPVVSPGDDPPLRLAGLDAPPRLGRPARRPDLDGPRRARRSPRLAQRLRPARDLSPALPPPHAPDPLPRGGVVLDLPDPLPDRRPGPGRPVPRPRADGR